jgi:hypothetical protein
VNLKEEDEMTLIQISKTRNNIPIYLNDSPLDPLHHLAISVNGKLFYDQNYHKKWEEWTKKYMKETYDIEKEDVGEALQIAKLFTDPEFSFVRDVTPKEGPKRYDEMED